jgi:cysteine desulfurase/selenocysteine lyase
LIAQEQPFEMMNEKEYSMFDVTLSEKIRSEFPGVSTQIDGLPVTYLDSAASSLKPQVMIDAVSEYYSGVSSNVHRGKNYSLDQVSECYEMARYRVAELLSCSGNEVIFLRNTTEAINLVASGLNLSKADDVVVFSDAHHSNLLPWMQSATIHTVGSTQSGNSDLAHYYQLLEIKPKIVAITHCSNVTGVYCPLAEMVMAAKAVGALVMVDAAQSVPHRKIDVKQLDIDYLCFSAHKMAGPTGVGVLYGKSHLLEQLKPTNLGGGMVDWVSAEDYQLRKIPHRFEAGTPHIAGAYGIRASIDYLNNIGFDKLEQHDRQLGRLMLSMALKRDYLRVINPDPALDRGAVLSFEVPSMPNLDDVSRILSDSYGFMCRNGHLCAQPYVTQQSAAQVLRISAYIYTTEAEIEGFFNALDEIGAMMF